MTDAAVTFEKISKCYPVGLKSYRNLLSHRLLSTVTRSFSKNSRAESQTSDKVWALRDISFEIEHGETVGFIGPNGAGKSTLLKILSRITKPTSGHGRVRGRVGSLLEVGAGFHSELTGRENIYLNGSILGMKRKEINSKFDEIVEFAEIGNLIDSPVKFYSSGQYVRLGFAVAAHLDQEILVLDEILAVGDGAFQQKSQEKMRQLSNEGRTVLFVSHRMDTVQALCTKVIWLSEGRLLDYGDTRTLIGKYESTFAPAVTL